MRFVALVLAAAIIGAGVGFSVAPVQAHGGDGGGPVETLSGFPACSAALNAQTSTVDPATCGDLIERK
jgi:hypothetical protein